MKKITAIALSTMITLSLTANVLANENLIATNTSNQVSNNFTISTNGNASLTAVPDIAKVNISIQNTSSTSADAAEKNKGITDNVITALIEQGVDANDIAYSYYSVYPSYEYNSTGSVTNINYEASTSLIITVRDIDNIGNIVSACLENGATSNNGITYDVENKDPYYQKALNEAIDIALTKANIIADSVGIQNPKILDITENSSYYVASGSASSMEYDMVGKGSSINNDITIYASVNVTLGQ